MTIMLECEKDGFEPIMYNDTAQYRESLRKLFSMNKANYPAVSDDVDVESKDELEYDDDATSRALTHIYSNTKEHPLFKRFYSKAAEFMFSTEYDIGLTILCSYDYLDVFIPCYREYMLTGVFKTSSIHYMKLYEKLYN
jgi:hypothetical protein